MCRWKFFAKGTLLETSKNFLMKSASQSTNISPLRQPTSCFATVYRSHRDSLVIDYREIAAADSSQ